MDIKAIADRVAKEIIKNTDASRKKTIKNLKSLISSMERFNPTTGEKTVQKAQKLIKKLHKEYEGTRNRIVSDWEEDRIKAKNDGDTELEKKIETYINSKLHPYYRKKDELWDSVLAASNSIGKGGSVASLEGQLRKLLQQYE